MKLGRALGLMGLALLGGNTARAHHGTATNRLGIQSTGRSFDVGADCPKLCFLSEVRLGLSHFGRVREGTRTLSRADLGRVTIGTLTPSLKLELKSGTRLSLVVPLGLSLVTPEGASELLRAGFGDVEAWVLQDLPRLGRGERFRWRLGVGLRLATGRHEVNTNLSLIEVTPRENGQLEVDSFDTRATLGAGSTAFLASSQWLFEMHQRWRIGLTSMLAQPLHRTRDQILWGRDLTVQASLDWSALPDRLGLQAGLALDRHGLDEIPAERDEAGPSRQRTGGRNELATRLDLWGRPGEGVLCRLGFRIPVFQDVGGIQLVEVFSVDAGCGIRLGGSTKGDEARSRGDT
ncbi:MAG: hypothetical protein AAF627_08860 [Myxococcota bacterium]